MSLQRVQGAVWDTSDNLVVDTIAQLPKADREGIIFVAGGTIANDGLGGWFRYDPREPRQNAGGNDLIDPTGTGIGRGCWIRQKYATAPAGTSFSEVQTATAGQTDVILQTFTYRPNQGEVSVYINGTRLTPYSYTELAANQIEIQQPMRLGDVIEIIKYEQPITGVPGQRIDAIQVQYDDRNASTIQATEVQTALDQLSAQVDHATGGATPTADRIPYVPVAPDTGSHNVQDALRWNQLITLNHIAGIPTFVDKVQLKTQHEAVTITFDNISSGMRAVNVQDALDELQAHIGEGKALDIEFDPSNTQPHVPANNVQSALEQMFAFSMAIEVALDEHKNLLTDAHDAMAISFDGMGTGLQVFDQVTNVEMGMLALEKQHADHTHEATEVTVDNSNVNLGATGVQGALEALRVDLNQHENAAGAHIAGNIDYQPSALTLVQQTFLNNQRLQTSNVQDALDALEILIDDHENTNMAHEAENISFPAGTMGIPASNVRDAMLWINQGNWRYMGHLDLTRPIPQTRSNAVNNFYTVPFSGLVDPGWIALNVFHPNGMPPLAPNEPPDIAGNLRYEVKGDGYCFEDNDGKLWYMHMPAIQGGIISNPAPGVSQAITAAEPNDIPLTLVTSNNAITVRVNPQPVLYGNAIDAALWLQGDLVAEKHIYGREQVFDKDGNLRQTASNVQFTKRANTDLGIQGTPLMVDSVLEWLGTEIKSHVDGGSNRHPAAAITFDRQPNIGTTDVQSAIEWVQNNLESHSSPVKSGAHLARNIGYSNQNSGMLAKTVQEAIDEVKTIVSAPPVLDAKSIKFDSSTNSLTELNVQTAISELNDKTDRHANNRPGDVAHQAEYIATSAAPGNWTYNNVDAGLIALANGLDAHTGKSIGVHTAASISFDSSKMPKSSSVTASDVQAALVQMAGDISTDIDGGTF